MYDLGIEENPLRIEAPFSKNIILTQPGKLTYLNPADIFIQAAPKLVFTEFKNADSVLFTGVQLNNQQKIALKYNQNNVAIEFAALSFNSSFENLYSWRLGGLEENWHTSRNNIAIYNNLAPGTYTLFVKAANSTGQWTDKPIMLHFTIKAPFYKTIWFILLSLLTIAYSIYYVVELRIKWLKEKFKLRNKIANDLHDEIGSTITSINILSNVSQQAIDTKPEQAKEMIQQITIQSKQIQQNMSDIVWSIRPDNEKMENLLVRMREYNAQTLEPLEIKTNFIVDSKIEEIKLPLEYRKEVLLIFKEAVNNIAKHANATEVTIQIEQTNKKLLLTIADNGQWKKNGNTTGTGTRSMQQRALAVNGKLTIQKEPTGTTVVFALSLT
jgi:signal transduction histidine kinase